MDHTMDTDRPSGFQRRGPVSNNVPLGPAGQRLPHGGDRRQRTQHARKTVDYNSAITYHILNRIYGTHGATERPVYCEPTIDYLRQQSVVHGVDNGQYGYPEVGQCINTKFIAQTHNLTKSAQQCSTWVNSGNRLLTGTQTGEFVLWNGITYTLDTMLTAHDAPVRCVTWSPNDQWLISCDDTGIIKYWQASMNNVKAFKAHKEPIRDLSFSSTSAKFCAASDDQTVSVWDFERCSEDVVLTGHGYDVKCAQWHPYKALIASGSKDTLIKLWDPRSTGKHDVSTIHGHKSTVSSIAWNSNGYWFASGSRDQLVKVYDIRVMREMHTYKAHRKEVTSLAWHPYAEELLVSGSYEGSMYYWHMASDTHVGEIENAHELSISRLCWHPMGHLLATSSYDQTCKFWVRNRTGDEMNDKYNVNALPEGEAKQAAVDMLVNTAKLNPQSMGRRTMEMDLFSGVKLYGGDDDEKMGESNGDNKPVVPGTGAYLNAGRLQHAAPVQYAPQQQYQYQQVQQPQQQQNYYQNVQQPMPPPAQQQPVQSYGAAPTPGNAGYMNPARMAMLQQSAQQSQQYPPR